MTRNFFIVMIFAVALAGCRTADVSVNNSPAKAVATSSGGAKISADGKDAAEVGIAADSNGRVFVVWAERDDKKNYDIFVQPFDASLTPASPPVRINPNPGEARAWYGDTPSIVSGRDGRIYVGWNRRYPDGEGGNDLMLSISDDGGKSFKAPVKINDDEAPASHGMHAMTVDDKGRVLFAWLDERYLKTHNEKAAIRKPGFPTAGAMLFHHTPTPAAKSESEEPDAELYFASVENGQVTPNHKVAAEICPCCRVAMVASSNGKVYLGYRKVYPGQFRHISVSASGDGGRSFTEPVQVADDQWKLFACPVAGPALAVNGDTLQIAWFAGGERGPKGLYTSASTDNGGKFSEPTLVSPTMLYGSPAFVGGSLVFGDMEKVYVSNTNKEPTELANGRTPTAVKVGDKIITAFVVSNDDRSSVWLTK